VSYLPPPEPSVKINQKPYQKEENEVRSPEELEIGSCVSGTPSFVGQSDSYVSDLRQGEVPSSVRRSSISITEKSKRKFL
jgi:hypothetical protein